MIYQLIMRFLCLLFLAAGLLGLYQVGKNSVRKEDKTLGGSVLLIVIAAIFAKLAGV